MLRLRPTSLRTQDISHLLTGVFRNLYTAEVIGEEVSASLIKARGSENQRHEEFVGELQQVTAPRPRAVFTRGVAPADRNGDLRGIQGAPPPGKAGQGSAPAGCRTLFQALEMQLGESQVPLQHSGERTLYTHTHTSTVMLHT